jgi:hypothetical protein
MELNSVLRYYTKEKNKFVSISVSSTEVRQSVNKLHASISLPYYPLKTIPDV